MGIWKKLLVTVISLLIALIVDWIIIKLLVMWRVNYTGLTDSFDDFGFSMLVTPFFALFFLVLYPIVQVMLWRCFIKRE